MSDANEALMYLEMLDSKLKARDPEITLWENYYEGIHRLQFATSRFRATWGNLFRELADNWCKLVVTASVERLVINGFRSETAQESDKDAMQIWKDNDLDADYKMAHTEAVKLGCAYLLVDQENKAYETDSPLITIEHPAQAIVLCDPANHRRRIAALKEWVDEFGRICATLYLPDRIYRFQAEDKDRDNEVAPGLTVPGLLTPVDYLVSPSSQIDKGMEWIPRKGVPFEVENTLGVVPLIPMRNSPTLKVEGTSDISDVIPLQDAVNKEIADMLIASEFSAFMQRWATGIEIPKDPQTGQPVNNQSFLASAARVWTSEDPEAKFGQFQASDLSNYTKAIEMFIQHIAALTRTPPHYLLGQSGAFPSGDSLTATETGLVAKVKAKQTDFKPAWREAISLAKKAQGSWEPGERFEPIWGDPEQRIYSQKVDGALKLSTIGTPQDALWEEIGKSPDEIERYHKMKEDMGQDPHSTLFAVLPESEPVAAPKPLNVGPDGNLVTEQNITQSERIARIND